MIKTYVMWGLFLAITVYMVYELFLGKKDDIEIPEPDEPQTDEERELTELAEKSVLNDTFEDSIEEQEQELMDKIPDPNRKLVRVFISESPVQARMIEMKLIEAGIESIIEPTGASLFPIDTESSSTESILVNEVDLDSAQEIIKKFIAEEKKQQNKPDKDESTKKSSDSEI